MTCSVMDCPHPVVAHGLCDGHVRRRYKGQTVHVPLAEAKRTPVQVLRDAAIGYADADSEDDEAALRADDRLRKAGSTFGLKEQARRISEGLRARAARGLPVGRPSKVSPVVALAAVQTHGGVQQAAVVLGCSRWAVWRALRRSGL